MLHFYDRRKFHVWLALAAIGNGFLYGAAQADTACYLEDGFAAELSAYVAEAEACIETNTASLDQYEDEILTRINREREKIRLAPIERRTGLDRAAMVHNLDMQGRQYTDHVDPEGRDHSFRIGALDRSQLTGAIGASVLRTDRGSDAGDIFVAMQEDEQNNINMLAADFTHMGVSVLPGSEGLHVTLLFTQMEGELHQDLPVILDRTQRVRADFSSPSDKALGWSLIDIVSKVQLAQGLNPVLKPRRLAPQSTARLNVHVSDKTNVKHLRGPILSAN